MPSSLNLVFRYHLIIPRTSSGPSQHRLDPFQGCIFFTESRLIRCNNSFFPQFLAQKILFFCLRSARKVFFFKIGQCLAVMLLFSPTFGPKNPDFVLKLSPSLFFLAQKVLFFLQNWSIFGAYTQFFPQLLAQKIFFSQAQHQLFFWPAKSFFL